jgi:branched-chain amino acid transport system substrate-binding protein
VKTKFKIVLLISAVILFILSWTGFKFFQKNDVAIHIAFVGPMSGENAIAGKSMTQAIQLYLDGINKQGGINNQNIVLDIFDDQNDPNQAKKVAQEIVEQNRAVAVIGHYYSSCSINGGKVYKKHGIPAITPASTHIEVTQNNGWYFRTVFNNNLQARFLAHYAKRILHQNTVSIIYTDETYGSSLANLFEKNSKNLIDIKYKWLLSPNKNLEPQIIKIVNDLKTKSDAGLIFLATHASEGIKLVKLIRDTQVKNPLIAPDSYAGKSFSQGFINYSKEKFTSGYYTNGIYVSTPFILDTANRQAQTFNTLYQKQYQEKPRWHAFYAVDAAMVLIEAIKQANILGKLETSAVDRSQIRQVLSDQFNLPGNAVKGTTGLNYFDKNGDILKSVSMGVYKNNHLISAFNQLQIMPRLQEKIDQLDLARQEGRIFLIDDQYMYKTDVVYTGIQLNNFSNFDPKKITYTLDFYLWFRFQEAINPQQIQFLNAIEPIKLGTPINEETLGKEHYLLYRVKGNFKGNFYSSKQQMSLIQQLLSINFRHNDLDRNHLIYVIDILGMELTKKTYLLDKIKEIKNKIALDGWSIKEINFFQRILKQKILGNPKYLTPGNLVEYSTFNAESLISNKAYAYYELLPPQFVLGFLIFSGVMTLLMILVSYKNNKVKRLKFIWIFQVIFLFLLLISTEIFVINSVIEYLHIVSIKTVIVIFKVLWWVIPAILLNMAVERFLWLSLEEATGRTVPNLMRFVTALLIYTLALFGVIAFVLEKPITSLLATSGVVTIIIGLAIQMNLSNIFSGIALNIDRSIRIGDWVQIGKFDEGKVMNINWRVTQIKTRRDYMLSIPNSTISTSNIHNFSYPDDQYWLLVRVPIEPKHDPRKVESLLLNAVLSVEQGIVKNVNPGIWLENIQIGNVNNEFVTNYVIFFKTENYQNKFRVLKNVWTNIWINLNQAGIIPATLQSSENGEEYKTAFTTPELEKVLNQGKLQDMLTNPSIR